MTDTTQPAQPRLHFDAAGNHLQEHGTPVHPDYLSVARKLGAPPCLQVLTRLVARRADPPVVVLYSCDLPFMLDWRLSSATARDLAASLLAAADTCDRLAQKRKSLPTDLHDMKA
ncbi:hypothetical protein [Hydrogenophaga sp.]|uniref:hypothetical protein n=1 Tax=Hydrogenophaga sp. TaxID=1904254 RepID=UPI003F702731